MLEPAATQIAAAFTMWSYKSHCTPGYNGTPVYRVLHNVMLGHSLRRWANIIPTKTI